MVASCTPDGQRPTLGAASAPTAPAPVGESNDPGVKALTALLNGQSTSSFTANYHVISKLGSTESDVRVVHDADHLAVTVTTGTLPGVAVYGGVSAATCSGTPITCKAGVDERPLSDLQLTSTFWGASAARSLNVQASRTTDVIPTSNIIISGQSATCVAIQNGTGVPTQFCALTTGLLARWDDQTRKIELTKFVAGVDPANFTLPARVTP